jgi:hypothetical protein
MATPTNPISTPTRPRLRAAACLIVASALAACVSAPQGRADAPPEPVLHESRTGVPFLMDLPVVGWLFQHRVTER